MYKKPKKVFSPKNPDDPRVKKFAHLQKSTDSANRWIGKAGDIEFDIRPYWKGRAAWIARSNTGIVIIAPTLGYIDMLLKDLELGHL